MLELDLTGRIAGLRRGGLRITGKSSGYPPPSAAAGRAITRARNYLREHYAEAVSLAELVELTGLSRFHLVHLFTRQIGLPPHAYQIHVRIERACTLLLSGMAAVEVAGLVGFSDQSHFTRHFRRIWQMTPGQYLRTVNAQVQLHEAPRRERRSGRQA